MKRIEGTTQQADRIASAIRKKDIGLNIISDEMYTRLIGDSLAYAAKNQIYLRRSAINGGTVLGDLIHEGTHALDFVSGFGKNTLKTVGQWEKRAYFYERQFYRWNNEPVRFDSINDMIRSVKPDYPKWDQLFNPY